MGESLYGMSGFPDGEPVFMGVNRHKFPWAVPTREDLESEIVNPRKVGFKFKELIFRMYDMHKPEDVEKYQKDKARLHYLQFERKAMVQRAEEKILTVNGDQHLFIIVEWVEADWELYKEGPDGSPVKVTAEDLEIPRVKVKDVIKTVPVKTKKVKTAKPVEVTQSKESCFLGGEDEEITDAKISE